MLASTHPLMRIGTSNSLHHIFGTKHQNSAFSITKSITAKKKRKQTSPVKIDCTHKTRAKEADDDNPNQSKPPSQSHTLNTPSFYPLGSSSLHCPLACPPAATATIRRFAAPIRPISTTSGTAFVVPPAPPHWTDWAWIVWDAVNQSSPSLGGWGILVGAR